MQKKFPIVKSTTPLLEVLKIIDESSLQLAIVVNDSEAVIGIITDGDIRRALLKGADLNADAIAVANSNFFYLDSGNISENYAIEIMRIRKIEHIPVLDENKRLVNLFYLNEFYTAKERPNFALILAGGKGTRISHLTDNLPKPLVKIAGVPILERILYSLAVHGFRRFIFATGYKAELIKKHFGDGSRYGVEIKYTTEPENNLLSTAGSLKLSETILRKDLNPFLVMNGDLYCDLDFSSLMTAHVNSTADATLVTVSHQVQVPYGVVEINQNAQVEINEKPIVEFEVLSGIYVLNQTSLDLISENEKLDMPDFIKRMVDSGKRVSIFQFRDNWIDIGTPDTLRKARNGFES